MILIYSNNYNIYLLIYILLFLFSQFSPINTHRVSANWVYFHSPTVTVDIFNLFDVYFGIIVRHEYI